MKMKRPHMSRLELTFEDKTAVQVFDGSQGWKVRPFLGRDEVEPFKPEEAKAASEWQDLDGPLVNYARKGTKVKLQGTESVEGHRAYNLLLTMKNGQEQHVWIDAANFLELKTDGEPRIMDGKPRNVSIFYRDYKKENGLNVPHVFETFVEGSKQSHKMTIEHVAINQPMQAALFEKPQLAVTNASSVRREK
jgi:outer membrane lipoprotein-sorting protein